MKLAKARQLGLMDWFLLTEAWVQLFLTHCTLSLLPASRWMPKLVRRPTTNKSMRLPLECKSEQRLITAVNIAARYHILPMTCLRRAMTLQAILARRGSFATLRMGVRKSKTEISAHAWLELGSRVINDDPDVHLQFSPLDIDALAPIGKTQ
ncbi:MAG: lasso peptide biosynthesis B2 protein [Gammaproteobacteria bacterium]|nr:lasso peptide biosynthesis B2 protein [Gammaproteobacteria bacterium]